MHVHLLRQRNSLRRVVLLAVALLAVCATTGSIAAAKQKKPTHKGLSGTWSGQYGGKYSGTFTLKWTQAGSKLSGSIALSSEGGKIGVRGTLRGTAISFGTVGGGQVITYKGSVSGASMSGTWHTPAGGGSWSAHRKS
jgi:hypothetical protein